MKVGWIMPRRVRRRRRRNSYGRLLLEVTLPDPVTLRRNKISLVCFARSRRKPWESPEKGDHPLRNCALNEPLIRCRPYWLKLFQQRAHRGQDDGIFNQNWLQKRAYSWISIPGRCGRRKLPSLSRTKIRSPFIINLIFRAFLAGNHFEVVNCWDKIV